MTMNTRTTKIFRLILAACGFFLAVEVHAQDHLSRENLNQIITSMNSRLGAQEGAGSQSGAITEYRFAGGSQQRGPDYFSVTLNRDKINVTVTNNGTQISTPGAVYIYDRDGNLIDIEYRPVRARDGRVIGIAEWIDGVRMQAEMSMALLSQVRNAQATAEQKRKIR